MQSIPSSNSIISNPKWNNISTLGVELVRLWAMWSIKELMWALVQERCLHIHGKQQIIWKGATTSPSFANITYKYVKGGLVTLTIYKTNKTIIQIIWAKLMYSNVWNFVNGLKFFALLI